MTADQTRTQLRMLARVGLAFLLALSCLFLAVQAQASERILDFRSHIKVQTDGSMVVRETIEVHAEGNRIRHGIYRDLPLSYRDSLGFRYQVGFQLLEVRADGATSDYHTQERTNGIRIYIGNKNVRVSRGFHRYTIVYRTDRQLGYFADHDELYWNVTGNGWAFPIEHAEAWVSLPATIPTSSIRVEGYTGPQGAKGQDYRASVDPDGTARFETTRPLPVHSGLTIVVSWPKGYVQESSARQKFESWMAANAPALVGIAGLLLMIGYYLIVWWRVGRDPEAGIIIPRYLPPEKLSPAALRYIERMGYDDKTFATALVGLAAKGYLQIDELDEKTFALDRRPEGNLPLTKSERALNAELHTLPEIFVIDQKDHSKIRAIRSTHERALKREYRQRYFNINTGYLLPGILILLATGLGTLLLQPSGEDSATGGFMTVWLSFWTLGVFMLLSRAYGLWRQAFLTGSGWAGAIAMSIFSIPFLGGEIFGIGMLTKSMGLLMVIFLVAGIGLTVLFGYLLKAPTVLGRRLLDKIEGFRLYLSVAEGSELKMLHEPKIDQNLFETYLPYAMALDVEEAWSNRFQQSLVKSGQSPSTYTQPTWYNSVGAVSIGSLADSLGNAMTSAISSASTPPGSSSGGGGGGSSGGGGGGGGGGGW